MPAISGGEELVKRWEQIEAIACVLEMAQRLLAEEDSEEIKQGARQLRCWRRQEGKNGNVGWIEIRSPSVSSRFRQKKETPGGEEVGRAEKGVKGKQKKAEIRAEYDERLDRFAEQYG